MPVQKKIMKEKKLRTLPAEFKGLVFQSNRITNAKYDFSLIQERIFNAVMCKLREPIDDVMHGTPVLQLELFSNENILVHIPLMAISKPAYYNKVRETLTEMATIKIEVPHIYKNQPGTIVQGLLAAWIPDGRIRGGEIVVRIEKHVAQMLVTIDRNMQGRPMQYTSFMIGVCLQAKNKYTPRIYKFISSWKEKKGTRLSLDDLRDMLQLGDKYPTFKDIKKRILLPVSKELNKIGDCSFNCSDSDFVIRDGKTVVGLNFKIFSIEGNLSYVKQQIASVKRTLSNIFGFTIKDLDDIQYLYDQYPMEQVNIKLQYLNEYLYGEKQKSKTTSSVPAFVTHSLKKDFPPLVVE